MEIRKLGRTGLQTSVLSFGCGFVGGLMIRGTPADRENAVAAALDLGINYFDTAALYGHGESEQNLGNALHGRQALIGTKVRIDPAQPAEIERTVLASVEGSLRRLGRDCVDLLQIHNGSATGGGGSAVAPSVLLADVAPLLQRLRQQGKVRFIGMTALGETSSLKSLIEADVFDTAQVAYSLLNPSAATSIPADSGTQDYQQLLDAMERKSMGSIGIRLLAGGALSGVATRHPVGMESVAPVGTGIGSAGDYHGDAAVARRFDTLIEQGYVDSLIEAALRYGVSNARLSTLAVGFSDMQQLQFAAACVEKGPLSEAALREIAAIQHQMFSATGVKEG